MASRTGLEQENKDWATPHLEDSIRLLEEGELRDALDEAEVAAQRGSPYARYWLAVRWRFSLCGG